MSEKASQITVENLYDLKETIAGDIFEGVVYPWEVLPKIHDFIIELGKRLPGELYEEKGENIWIAKSATVAPTACLWTRMRKSGTVPSSGAMRLWERVLWWEIPQS